MSEDILEVSLVGLSYLALIVAEFILPSVLLRLIEADRGLGMVGANHSSSGTLSYLLPHIQDGYNALQSRSHCFESSVPTLSVAFASPSRCKNSYSFSIFAVTSSMMVHIVQ
jgi:hypothetical protein